MNATLTRLLSTVIVPVALVAGAVGCHHDGAAKAVAMTAEPAVAVIYSAPLTPKDRPDLAVYTARVDGESRTEIFVQGKAGQMPRMVYVDAEPGELVRVSHDGSQIVYRRFVSPGVTQDFTVNVQNSAI